MIKYLTSRPSLRMRRYVLESCGAQTVGVLLNMIPLFQLYKDKEIEELRRRLREHAEVSPPSGSGESVHHFPPERRYSTCRRQVTHASITTTERQSSTCIEIFTGEDLKVRLDDWLPSLERAKMWNDRTDELMLQLAGHLCGRARQEWSLLDAEAKSSYTKAVKALRLRLDPGSRTLAAQEFCHTYQGDTEKVADFIRRLERTFNVAYGREGMSVETRDTLLHGQLQDGLKHDLMQAPAVSGAQTYQELCFAARNEEKRLAELPNQSTNQLDLPHLVVPILVASSENASSVMSLVT